jgi:predicted dinucleotide-binding enzyme
MKIAVVGAGKVGAGLGGILSRAGHEVVLSFARDEQRLQDRAKEIGATAGSPADATTDADAILFAPPNPVIPQALDACGDLTGKVLIDCTNDVAAQPGSTSLAERIAQLAPGASVVKAFNTVFAALYDEIENSNSRPDMLYCGDDEGAKATAAEVIKGAGFEPIDVGSLKEAGALEAFARLVIDLAYRKGRGPFVYQFRPPSGLGQ